VPRAPMEIMDLRGKTRELTGRRNIGTCPCRRRLKVMHYVTQCRAPVRKGDQVAGDLAERFAQTGDEVCVLEEAFSRPSELSIKFLLRPVRKRTRRVRHNDVLHTPRFGSKGAVHLTRE
jgi:hypothetical protein